jgi:adenylate kinase
LPRRGQQSAARSGSCPAQGEASTAMRIVFIGPPGAGKGTQSKRLIDYLNVPHLSTGDILRQARTDQTQVGAMAAQYMDSGRLVPDPIVVAVVGERLQAPDCKVGCLFDGFPRTIGQAKALDNYLNHYGDKVNLALVLEVDKQTLIGRLSGRNRDDDKLETVQRRFEQFVQMTQPLLDYYDQQGKLRRVDGLGTPDDVFLRIKKFVDEETGGSLKQADPGEAKK